jgi:hypothetical protein
MLLYPPLAEDVLNIGCHVFATPVRMQSTQFLTSLGFSPRQELLQCYRKFIRKKVYGYVALYSLDRFSSLVD